MKIIAVGSHIDDIEYNVGGTLLRHRDAGDKIFLVITHSDDYLAGDVDQRKEEQRQSAIILGAEVIFFNKDVSIEKKVGLLDEIAPNVIYYPLETDHHQHHVETSRIGFAVARNFNITALQYIAQRSYSYFPNYYVVIDFKAKKELVSVFKSQNGRQPKFMEIMEAQNKYFGSQIPGDGHYAEGFVIHRMVVK